MSTDMSAFNAAAYGDEEELPNTVDENKRRAGFNVDQASQEDPDKYAETRNMSKQTGLPEEVVKSNKDEVKRNINMKAFNDAAYGPKLNEFLAIPGNANVAYDDIEGLSEIETNHSDRPWDVDAMDVALSVPAGLLKGTGAMVSGAGRLYDGYRGLVNKGVRNILPEAAGDYLYDRSDENETVNRTINALTNFGGGFVAAGGLVKKGGEALGLTPEERESLSYWESLGIDVLEGTGQVAGQILGTMFGGPVLGLAQPYLQGADQASERQIASGTLGQDAVADGAIFTGAAITGLTENPVIDKLINGFKFLKFDNKVIQNLTDITIAGGMEAVQEVAEGILQGVNEMITTNPDVEIFEGLDREALAAGGTGALIRSLVMMMTPGKTDTSFIKAVQTRINSEESEAWLDRLVVLSQSSKLNERDAEIFAEYIDTLNPDDHVYLDAEIAGQIVDAPQYITDQLDGTGAGVSIPLAKFLTEMANNEETLTLVRPHLKMLPELLSRQELDAKTDNLQVKKLMENAEKHKADLTEADMIFNQVQAQLKATGRQGEHTSRQSSSLIPAYIVTTKAKLAERGIEVSVKDLFDEMKLSIVGPKGKKPAESETVLNQDEQTEYDAAVAKGLDMGQPARKARATEMGFDVDKKWYRVQSSEYVKGDLTEKYFTSNPKYAESYTKDVVDFYDEIPTTIPVYINPSMFKIEKDVNKVTDYEWYPKKDQLISEGFTGIMDSIGDVMVVFDPSQIRSVNAAFDPDHAADSANILSQSDPTPTQKFGDQMLDDTGVDEAGNVMKLSEKAQTQWNHHQKRIKMVENLRACING